MHLKLIQSQVFQEKVQVHETRQLDTRTHCHCLTYISPCRQARLWHSVRPQSALLDMNNTSCTQTHTRSLTRTQTKGLFLALALLHRRNAHTRWVRGQMEAQCGLLAFHTLCFFSFTDPFPSLSLSLSLSLCSSHFPRSSAPFLLCQRIFITTFCVWPFYLFSLRLRAFSLCERYVTTVDCVAQNVRCRMTWDFREDCLTRTVEGRGGGGHTLI